MAWASPQKVALGCIAFVIWWVLAVFPAVPFLPIGRTAGSLVGAALMVVLQVISPSAAFASVDLPILGLLFGTMVISVYLERADLFKYLALGLSWRTQGGKDLLCRISLLAAVSSALFTNDTTCVVLTPFVLKVCNEKNLHPKPFLIALACSANIGSAATSIGNPQNLVIAVSSGIGFGKFLLGLFPSVAVGLVINTVFLLVVYWKSLSGSPREEEILPSHATSRGASENGPVVVSISPSAPETPPESSSPWPISSMSLPRNTGSVPDASASHDTVASSATHVDTSIFICTGFVVSKTWREFRKFIRVHKRRIWKISVYLVALGMLAALLAGLSLPWTAITAAVVMMVIDFSDAGPSLDKVSYSLLVFFSGMFITVAGFNATGAPEQFWTAVEPHSQINTASGEAVLSLVVIVLSNVVSNVPTVLLLGSRVAQSAAAVGASATKAWLILAWVSTVAGNLTLVGSAANIIVCEQARRTPVIGYNLSFWNHLKFGFPSTLIVIAVGLPLIAII